MKVGKALYNILGSSKEIQENFPFNTTDYTPSSTELVKNGDFSATGSELVTNGDFSEGSSGWTLQQLSGSVTFANNQVQIVSTGASAQTGITQDILVNDKLYKVTIDIASISGTLKLQMGGNNTPPTLMTTSGVHTFYLNTIDNILTNGFLYLLRNVGNSLDVVINSISVKELGEDWTLEAGWYIGENGAYYDGTGGTNKHIKQNIDITDGKSYKIVYTVSTISAGAVSVRFGGMSGVSEITATTTGTFTGYITANSNANGDLLIEDNDNNFVGSISNVLVKEMVVTKIFPEIAPTGINAPYIVYSVVSNQPSESKEDNGAIDTASVEVYSFQDTYNKAIDLGVDVRAALKRVNGTYNTIDIQSIDYTNEQMDVNEKRDLWASIQDYEIRVKN